MRYPYVLLLGCLMLCASLKGRSQTTKTFNYTGDFEKYVVPTTGWYLLEAGGAQGGPSSEFSHTGGNGAFIQCNVRLMAGDTLRIAVGGMGMKGYSVLPLTSGGGGGGGSSIVKVNGSTQVPLVFAGGGGGATSGFDGMPGLPGREGGMGGALQGDGGNGGRSPFGFGGGGYSGSGLLSETSGSQQQGSSYLSGNAGGMALSNGGQGGWGGGGAGALGAAWNNNPTGGGGGGGGYTGGAGGGVDHAAGGGGSYFRNDDNAYTHGLKQVQGGNYGNGKVTITLENDFIPPTNLFRFRGEPSYHFTVPVTGWYLLEASGAQGGLSPSNLSETGGPGAVLQGYVKLTAGETLYVYVGGMGKGPTVDRVFPDHFPGAGGGGATYIIRVSGITIQPLLVAGGGGGWGVSGNGSPGLSASYGGAGAGDGGIGGSGGNGGTSKRNGAGGAGFLTDGGSHCNGTCADNDWLAFGGQCFKSGNRGGYAGIKFNDGNNYAVGIQGGSGGWGGGGQGGASWDSYHGGGGGGGGYSGGGAGGSEKSDPTAGGGGSFTADEVYAYGCVALTGANLGDGLARIEYVPKLELPTRYGYKSNTFQRFVAPKTGWYLLDASGAQGGQSSTFFGGRGARIQGYTSLQAGDTLLIAVGGMGQKGVSNGNRLSGGGGGGSTSIVKVNGPTRVPLLVVGGGGGAASRQNGYLGLNTLNGGTAAKCGGSEGWGGCIGDNKRGGGGGAGYKGDGGTHCDGICNGSNVLSYGGQAYLSGNSGGATSNYGGDGGWGGGGEGGGYTILGDGGGGGGGGWSGGGGADPGYGGGGGGSYVAPELDTLGCLSLSGANDGDGGVSVKYLSNYLGTNTITFVNRGKIFQYFKVPKDGFYQLEARGAQGGICYGIQGGLGATLKGNVFLKAGDSLQIAAGGSGGMAGLNLYDHSAAGGGGATSIVKLNPPSSGQRFTPLFIAAGGGGASRENPGGDGQANQSGFEPRSSIGKGGLVNYDNSRFRYGGAGGGFYQAGDTSYSDLLNKAIALPGQSYLSGNAGGGGIPNNSPDKSDKYGPEGGWGGGGQGGAEKLYGHQYMSWSTHSGGGGGGGYTGGSVFGNKNRSSYGGGSFVSPSFVMTGLTLLAGDNLSEGVAIIAGPRTSTDTVRSPGTYTWPRNGVSYRSSGLYVWVDSVNAITRTLDLRITVLGGSLGSPVGGSLMAYPNPSNGQLTLRTPSLEVAAKLEIYAVDGRRVQEYDVPARTTRFKVDLRRHGAGVYMFRMVAEGEDEHIKVIVE